MVVWINGAFGAGKTTMARRLVRMRRGAWLFDPEQIGFMLRKLLPRDQQPPDFQDLPIWREMTVDALTVAAADPSRMPVVPMTLVNPDYFREIVGGLRDRGIDVRHFSLVASPATLRRRIRWRADWPSSRRWALAQLERCASALAEPEFAIHIPTDERGIAEIAQDILTRL